jgi:arginase
MPAAVDLLVVPWDSGIPAVRMGAGPRELIRAGLAEHLGASISEYAPGDSVFRGEVASAFHIQRWIASRVSASRETGSFPLVLAGNCMSAVGTFAGLRSRSRKVPGVCWFDAHADFNTPETSMSGFLDGMALATLTGRCWTALASAVPDFRPAPESSVVMFGTRDLDRAEERSLSASDINWPGAARKSSDAGRLSALRGKVGEVYLHVDLDVLDESVARVNQFACPGGLSVEQLLELITDIGENFHVGAAAITAWDPAFDPDRRVPEIARTIASAIVKTVS